MVRPRRRAAPARCPAALPPLRRAGRRLRRARRRVLGRRRPCLLLLVPVVRLDRDDRPGPAPPRARGGRLGRGPAVRVLRPGAHAPARVATYDVTQVVSQGWHHQSPPGIPPGPRSTGLQNSADCSQKSHAGPFPAAAIQPTLLAVAACMPCSLRIPVISPRQRLGGGWESARASIQPQVKAVMAGQATWPAAAPRQDLAACRGG